MNDVDKERIEQITRAILFNARLKIDCSLRRFNRNKK